MILTNRSGSSIPVLILMLVLFIPIIMSLLTSFLRVDVAETFECWCRSDDPTSSGQSHSKSPSMGYLPNMAGLPAGTTPLLPAAVQLSVTNQLTQPLPTFGMNPFQYTLLFWIKIPSLSGVFRSVLRFGPDDANRRPGLWVSPNSTSIHYRHDNATQANWGFDAIPGIQQNVWAHFAMVVSGRVMTAYINGNQAATATSPADLLLPSDQVYFCQNPVNYLDQANLLSVASV